MFYDLNLPVDGVGDLARREVIAMAMQLGYSGVAANHVVMGNMGETDRCRIRPLELQVILSAAPGVAEAARFHQKLLGVPQGLPFRQFTRITVVLETPAQANAVNSANPVLKTYDLVAVRPANQKMFNHVCSHLEVDLISIDFSQKLPFRMKASVIKAAVERGIYFEICYGRALVDPKGRRELFINSLILQEAGAGRNVVVCSGARKAMEIRGPNDVANMATLFGFSLELAKKSVSRTCKSLLLHGIARKTYKAAIHVQRVESAPTGDEAFSIPMDWDPLTVGGASADFLPVTETSSKSVSNMERSDTAEIGSFIPIKVSSGEGNLNTEFSEGDGSDEEVIPLSLSGNCLAVGETVTAGRDRSELDKLVRKDIITASPAKHKANQKRRGNAVVVDNKQEAQGNRNKRRKKKK